MFSELNDILYAAEDAATTRDIRATLRRLRLLGLMDFGQLLWSLPDERFPMLSQLLPRMAAVDVQRRWTGNSGLPLLRESATFVHVMQAAFHDICGRSLRDITILDYGCGYGRLLRLMLYFTDSSMLWGIDPDDRSIAICTEDGLPCHLAKSDYLPSELPVNCSFDLIYAYSVFTHTSVRATRTSLSALRRHIKPDGMLAITVRPVEFWEHYKPIDEQTRDRLVAEHRQTGFAFRPHGRAPIDGDVTYGDVSIAPEWLRREVPQWKYRGHDRGHDLLQTVHFFTPD